MRTIRFGRTNIEVPAVSLGTWGHGGPNTTPGGQPVGWSGHDDRLATEAIRRAYEAGITHWDTADVYGNGHAEELIGKLWNRIPRSEIFLATKVGWDPGPYGHFYHPEQIEKQMARSLRNLRVDQIDLYYLHHCDFGPDDTYFDGALEKIRRFRDEGKIRFIGLSDWDSHRIMRFIDRVDPDVVQPYRNVVDDAYEASGLKAWVEAHDAGVAFFSPIKHGLLLGKYDRPATFEAGDFRSRVSDFHDARVIGRMKSAAAAMRERFPAHREPVLHAVIGALLSDAPTGCVLLGQRSPRHVEAAAAVGEPLIPEDVAFVRRMYRGQGSPPSS